MHWSKQECNFGVAILTFLFDKIAKLISNSGAICMQDNTTKLFS